MANTTAATVANQAVPRATPPTTSDSQWADRAIIAAPTPRARPTLTIAKVVSPRLGRRPTNSMMTSAVPPQAAIATAACPEGKLNPRAPAES